VWQTPQPAIATTTSPTPGLASKASSTMGAPTAVMSQRWAEIRSFMGASLGLVAFCDCGLSFGNLVIKYQLSKRDLDLGRR
jgi:hypothetical protein